MSTGPPPAPGHRVRVTSSRRGATPARSRTVASALAEQTQVGELYLHGLLRAQLRLTLTVLGVGALALLGLPTLFALVPSTRALALGPIPFPWLVLGVLLYPAMVALAWWYTRHAQRLERLFIELITRENE